MRFSDEKQVEKSLKSFEDQKLDAEAMKHLVGGAGSGGGQGDDEDGGEIVSDDIILP